MVLPPAPAHASPAPPRWLDRLVVALELSGRAILTLVDNAVPARLREAYLRLRACGAAVEVIVDVRGLAALPRGTTAILVLESPIVVDDLDWLNLNRPVLVDRELKVVLWCEPGIAPVVARRAPDAFDWIAARVECPSAPAPHAVAEIAAAIRARAPGITWVGPGLDEALAAIRPGRAVRRVAVASYQSMLDALTSRDPGWLVLEGIDTAFHVRRLGWAMAETWRRVIVFRQVAGEREPFTPGWPTLDATLVPIAHAVHAVSVAGGTGSLAALTGLAPEACVYACFALRRGMAAASLEALLAGAVDPQAALRELARASGWTSEQVFLAHDPQRTLAVTRRALAREAARQQRGPDQIVAELGRQLLAPEQWARLGEHALDAGDFEVAIRWLTAALRSLPREVNSVYVANVLAQRARAHRLAGDFAAARRSAERASELADKAGDATLEAIAATELGYALLHHDEPQRARDRLEAAVHRSRRLGASQPLAELLEALARTEVVLHRLDHARAALDEAVAIKRRVSGDDDPSLAVPLGLLGFVRLAQDDPAGGRADVEHALELSERTLGPEHPSIAVLASRLAQVHREARDLPAARALLDRALAIQRATLGDVHPDVADTLVTRAEVLADGGSLDDALATLEEALAIQQKVFGDDGQLAGARTRRALASVLVKRGRLAHAIDHVQRALETLRRIHLRADHPDIVSALGELARWQALKDSLRRLDDHG